MKKHATVPLPEGGPSNTERETWPRRGALSVLGLDVSYLVNAFSIPKLAKPQIWRAAMVEFVSQ